MFQDEGKLKARLEALTQLCQTDEVTLDTTMTKVIWQGVSFEFNHLVDIPRETWLSIKNAKGAILEQVLFSPTGPYWPQVEALGNAMMECWERSNKKQIGEISKLLDGRAIATPSLE